MPQEACDNKVGIYFPRFESREPQRLHAVVDCCLLEHEDDIVLLKLVDGRAPLGPEQLALLGSAEQSEGHIFRSYGYSPTGEYPATRAEGSIRGSVEWPEGKKLLVDPIQLSSQEIDHGMSGSAVLDTELNKVVGLVAARYFPKGWIKGNISYAVDNRVLTFNPFLFPLHNEPNPLRPAPEPRIDKAEARAAVAKNLGRAWNNSPPSLAEWVGRKGLLSSITDDWIDSKKRVTGLIGFGGEGKSSLARRWVDELIGDNTLQQPDGLFWWGFYGRRNVDEFFEAALNYMSGGRIDAKKIPSASMRAQIIAAMLRAGRYLFILDGLEVLQHQDGDLYGSLRSQDLKSFLEFFASPEHDSFCLVTSRAPLMDLEEYTTYRHRDVNRLSPKDGRDLLCQLGVQGKDKELGRVVKDWDGHALTLSLLASYLKDRYGGDIRLMENIPLPTADEPRYERVHRVLRRYDEHLTPAERSFLKFFSVFRKPVDEEAFDRVFRAQTKDQPKLLDRLLQRGRKPLNADIALLDDTQFRDMVKKLVAYRILRRETETGQYTAHPLVRAHYYDLLTSEPEQTKKAHFQVKEYFLAQAQDMPDRPSMEELRPLIEAVHHACKCEDYDEAYDIQWRRINRQNERYIVSKLGAWETALEIMQEFFPQGDISQEPEVSNPHKKAWILNAVGICLDCTGRGERVEGFYQRSLSFNLDSQNWASASAIYRNLSELYSLRGELDRSFSASKEAQKMARRAERKEFECMSLAYHSWALHLQGQVAEAGRAFQEAEALGVEFNPSIPYLHSIWGIQHADHLRRAGDADYACKVTETNLRICEENHFSNDISRCHRVLGDLCADAGLQDEAAEHYCQALDIAREISMKHVLIEALLARGRWEARILQDPEAAFSDLKEALDHALAGGYRIYEADIRVALAWANLAVKKNKSAREEAAYALQMSEEMGYHWGKVDANEVLAEIDKIILHSSK